MLVASAGPVIRLDDVGGFVFDVDGSLVHRGADFRSQPLPGAVEVLEAIRASGPPAGPVHERQPPRPGDVRGGLREDGLPVADAELLTPVCSARSPTCKHRHPGRAARWSSARRRSRRGWSAKACHSTDGEEAEAVFVAHVEEVDLATLEVPRGR